MVVHPFAIGRKNGSVSIVNRHCKVCPPHKHLQKSGAVIYAYLCLYVASALIYRNTRHTFHSAERLYLPRPYGFSAVRVILFNGLKRHKCGRSVVLRPVKLNSARNPRTRKTDKRRLYNLVIINKVIIANLIKASENFTTQSRNNLSFNILVFKRIGLILHIGFLVRNTVAVRYRVYPARRTLIRLIFKEHRQLMRLFRYVCRYFYTLFLAFYI